MRLRAAVAALALFFPLAVRAAEEPPELPRGPGSPAECARLNKQIHHFEDMAERADNLGNAMWTERMEQQVELLKDRQEVRCPRDHEDASAKEALIAFMRLLKVAGQAALSYFTFGAF